MNSRMLKMLDSTIGLRVGVRHVAAQLRHVSYTKEKQKMLKTNVILKVEMYLVTLLGWATNGCAMITQSISTRASTLFGIVPNSWSERKSCTGRQPITSSQL